MELKNLVPPLELCKLIPQGEFEDSAMMCEATLGMASRQVLDIRIMPRQKITNNPYVDRKLGREYYIYPAPTTDEILDKCKDIPGVLNPTLWWQGIWKTDCAIDKSGKLSDGFFDDADLCNLDLACAEDKSAATAALRMWLKLKGIEDGE
jgi:hypothetical protein